MKNYFFKYTFLKLIIALLFLGARTVAQEFEANNYKMAFSLKTAKNYDNSRLLEVSFIAKNKKNRRDKIPIYDAEIKFFNVLNDTEQLLGLSNTSNEGISTITLPDNHNYLIDEEGNINLIARFSGSESIDEQEAEVTVKNLHLELDLIEIDSVKTIQVKAFTIDSSGMEIMARETDIIVSMEAMFSKMNLAEGIIDDGEFEFKFLEDFPGDVNGDITVYAIIEDNDEFGNVIQKKTIGWGSINNHTEIEKYALWASLAPIWMYIVLTVMLVGVWANYVYTILNLYIIKKEGSTLEI